MRLITKISIAMAAVILSAAALSAVLVVVLIYPSYEQLDREAALRNGHRVHELLRSELDHLAAATRDWAHWDDTYAFATAWNDEYVAANLKMVDLQNLGVDSFMIVGDDRVIAFRRSFDPATSHERALFADSEFFPKAAWAEFDSTQLAESREGFTTLAGVPSFIAMSPILTSQQEGPSPARLVFTRDINETLLARLRDKAQMDFEIVPYSESEAGLFPIGADGALQTTALGEGEDSFDTHELLVDVSGAPSLVLKVPTARRFSEIGRGLLTMIVGGLVTLALFVSAAAARLMARLVADPVAHIVGHMKQIATTGNLESRLDIERRDEVGDLARGFDAMIDELRETRRLMQEQSYFGGMADLAAGVLHNVRNALNPIATAVWKADKDIKDISFDRLRQAGEALSSDTLPAERRRKMAAYVTASADHIGTQCANVRLECETIRTFSAQIEAILKDHDAVSRGPRQSEALALAGIVWQAAEYAINARDPFVDVAVAPDIDLMPRVRVQRVVLLQVLGNLIVNAVDAIRRAGSARGKIDISARACDEDGRRFVELTVSDNGIGIEPDQISLLFQKGYSTRGTGTGGLGLHWCANSIAAMHGTIRAESGGKGRGATLRLTLPAEESLEEVAA